MADHTLLQWRRGFVGRSLGVDTLNCLCSELKRLLTMCFFNSKYRFNIVQIDGTHSRVCLYFAQQMWVM